MSDEVTLAAPADVAMCYRVFLRREPTNIDAIERHLTNRPTIWQLVQSFIASQECEPIKIEDGCSAIWSRQDSRAIRAEGSAAANAEILEHLKELWSGYGEEDPYYSVVTDPAYRANNITSELTERFYETGFDSAVCLRQAFERNRIDVDPRWHILELGCGVGRIGEHFCGDFEYYNGVDISSTHLAHAMTRFSSKNITNARLLLLREALQGDMNFDIFYSMLVLQYNPPPIIYYLLDQFFAKLKPNGFAFFQLPCHLYGYSFDIDRYIADQGSHGSIEMHALPQKYVFELLYKHRLQPIEVCPYSAIGPIGISYIFFARKGIS